MATPLQKNPCPGVHKFTVLVTFLYSLLLYTQDVWSMLGSREECIFSICLLCPHPSARIPAPGVKLFTNSVDLSLVIIASVCLIYAQGYRGTFYKKYTIFNIFTPYLYLLRVWGHYIYNLLSPYPINGTLQIW